MVRILIFLVMYFTLVQAFTQSGHAADWTQWRGTNGEAVAAAEDLPDQWPEKLTQRWSVEIGTGHASPVVKEEHVFCFSRVDENEIVRCLNLQTGKEVWSKSYAAPYKMHSAARNHGKGPKSSPALSDDAVITLGISGILSCFEQATGKLRWQKEFGEEFKATSPLYGTATSPLVYGTTVIAHVGGHKDGSIRAFDLTTGNVKWSWAEDGPGYASPTVVKIREAEHMVTQTQNFIVSLDPKTGKLLWKISFRTAYEQNSISVVARDNVVFVSGYQTPLTAYRVERFGSEWRTEQLWKNLQFPLYMSSPVISESALYGISQKRRGLLFSVNLRDGQERWTNPGRSGDHGSIIVAGKYLLASFTTGKLQVVENNTRIFRVVRTYQVSDKPVWSHPVIASKSLLTKDATHLTCWDYIQD